MRTLHASPPQDAAITGPVLFPFTGAGVGGSHISTFNLARSLAEDGTGIGQDRASHRRLSVREAATGVERPISILREYLCRLCDS